MTGTPIQLTPELFTKVARMFRTSPVNGIELRTHPSGEQVLAWLHRGEVYGWLIWFPDANEFLVFVHPLRRREGVGTALIREAQSRWRVDLDSQSWTCDGAKLRDSFLKS